MSNTETIQPPPQVHQAASTSETLLLRATSNGPSTVRIEQMGLDDSPANVAEPEIVYPTGLAFSAIVLSVSCILVISGLDGGILPTAVPAITDHFHTVQDVGWYYTSFRLCSCSFQFLFGTLYKLFHLKRILLISVAIFLLGIFLSAVAPNSKTLVLGRAICGLGTSGITAGCFSLLPYILPLRKRPLYTGILGGVECMASLAGPTLGGVLTQALGWRSCFWTSIPLGVITLVICAYFLDDLDASEAASLSWREILAQLDLLGNLIFLPSIVMLLLALSWAGVTYPWNSPIVISLFCAWAMLFCGFAYSQYRRGDAATLPPRILRQRCVYTGAVFVLCCASTLSILEYWLPVYYQTVRSYSPVRSGYMMLPIAIGFLVAILFQGAGTSLVGYHKPFALAASLLLSVAAGLLTTWSLHITVAKLIAFSLLAGLGAGLGFQTPQIAVQSSLSPADAPLGLSIILFAQNFGPALFMSIAQAIFTNRLSAKLPGLDIASTGFTDLKTQVGGDDLERVLMGFDRSLSQTWYLAIGLSCATLIGSGGMEWASVNEKRS